MEHKIKDADGNDIVIYSSRLKNLFLISSGAYPIGIINKDEQVYFKYLDSKSFQSKESKISSGRHRMNNLTLYEADKIYWSILAIERANIRSEN